MIRVENLRKSYKDRVVISDVSFETSRGEVFAILGPNGAGKTTCFYMVFGIIKPDYGRVLIDGNDITDLPIHMRSRVGLGYLPQESSIFQELTTEENIMCALENFYPDKSVCNQKLEDLLNEFSIQHIRKTRAMSLSGGERRRLEIARLLATDPDYVLLDEPFAGVDPVSINEVIKIIKMITQKGKGVIITDHNVRETMKVADRICVIYDGKVLVSGSNKDILSNDLVRDIYLGHDFNFS